jgi:Ca-dependent carbohydrate-binding module xylan-binding
MKNSLHHSLRWLFVGGCVVASGCADTAEPRDDEALVDSQGNSLVSTVIEAETLTGGGAISTDAAASGGQGLSFWGNGAASKLLATQAIQSITVRARGDQCSGAPNLKVSIDGVQILSTTVAATVWTDYSAPVALPAGNHTFQVTFDNDTAVSGSCDRNLRVDKISVVSPAPIWQPTDLGAVTWTRPTGADYVTWESLVGTTAANAQAAAPQTPVILTATFMKSITGNKILSLPKGIFEAENGFSHYVNDNMIGIGKGYATGLRGIVGSGSHSTPGSGGAETIVRMHGTVTGTAGQGPQGNLIIANGVVDPYFGGFSLVGNQTRGDNVFHAGIMLNTCTGTPVIERMYLKDASPGYGNSPPGETFGINVYKTPNAVIRDTEIDGRDFAGNRTSASPIGWNSVVNDTSTVNVQRVYTHHGLTGMLTFWQTTNLITEDYYTYSWSSGTGALSGSGINHEQSGGRIRHIRPRLFLNGAKSSGPVRGAYGHPASDTTPKTASNGSTFGLASGLSDAGADFEMWYPQFDNTLGSSGLICMASYDGYALGQAIVTPPKVYLSNSAGVDYQLNKVDHPNAGWSSADPLTTFAWIH